MCAPSLIRRVDGALVYVLGWQEELAVDMGGIRYTIHPITYNYTRAAPILLVHDSSQITVGVRSVEVGAQEPGVLSVPTARYVLRGRSARRRHRDGVG